MLQLSSVAIIGCILRECYTILSSPFLQCVSPHSLDVSLANITSYSYLHSCSVCLKQSFDVSLANITPYSNLHSCLICTNILATFYIRERTKSKKQWNTLLLLSSKTMSIWSLKSEYKTCKTRTTVRSFIEHTKMSFLTQLSHTIWS